MKLTAKNVATIVLPEGKSEAIFLMKTLAGLAVASVRADRVVGFFNSRLEVRTDA